MIQKKGLTVNIPWDEFIRIERLLASYEEGEAQQLKEANRIRTEVLEVARQLEVFMTFLYDTARDPFIEAMKAFNEQSTEAQIVIVHGKVKVRILQAESPDGPQGPED